MKIGIVSTHSFPIPYTNLHTGDIVILNFAKELQSMGHDVVMFAPDGTDFNNLRPMKASFGKYPPSSQQCELECFHANAKELMTLDIVHDFSNTKCIVNYLNVANIKNTVSTLMGGAWKLEYKSHNLITWSKAHQNRVSRGATDYENTPTPDLAGPNGLPAISHAVYGGVDTNFYTPSYDKEDFFLWMGRWHNVRGYELAINLAKQTGINLVLAGEHPENELFESQKSACQEAVMMAAGYDNISFQFLPNDPNHHTAKRKLYRQAKAFLYTVQFHEPFGLSQVESLACGTPVIGPNFGSVPEVVSHKQTGFICDNTIESYSHAISKIDSIDIKKCRTNSESRFSMRQMANGYLSEYDKILKGRHW